MLPAALPETRELLMTARIVLTAAADPKIPPTVQGLAMATGLTEEAVREILASAEYFQAFAQDFRSRTGMFLMRGMSVMDSIVNDEEARKQDRVNAYRALVQTWATLHSTTEDRNSIEAVQNLQQKLEAIRRIKAAKVQVISTDGKQRNPGRRRRPPDPPSSHEEATE